MAEVTGRVTDLDWANPHSVITIMGSEEGAAEAEWRIEATASAMIFRSGINRDTISVGDSVRASGFRGKRNRNAIFLTNFLLADGREWIAPPATEPMWSDRVVGTDIDSSPAAAAGDQDGIFRVWSVDVASLPQGDAPRTLWNESYPLTNWAAEAQANWDRSTSPYVDCANGMPAIMDTPLPMEFLREGDNIVLRFEELDSRRLIIMGDQDRSRTDARAAYGFSSGTWDGETLIVRTAGIDWPLFDQDGIPQTENTEIVETFSLAEGGRFLTYTATVTDDQVFTEPVILERWWTSLGEEIQPYECRWDETGL